MVRDILQVHVTTNHGTGYENVLDKRKQALQYITRGVHTARDRRELGICNFSPLLAAFTWASRISNVLR
jgi:hypothetical protein